MLGNADWPDPGENQDMIYPLEAHGVRFISMGNLVTKKTPLIWRGAMVHGVLQQFLNNVAWGELDVLLIDMPPGTGDAQITIGQSVPLTGVIAVTTPQLLSVADTVRGIEMFRKLDVPILGLIENMSAFVCDACGDRTFPFGAPGGALMSEKLDAPFLGAIPLEPAVSVSGDSGAPQVIAHPESGSARAIESIIDRLLVLLENKQPGQIYEIDWRTMAWDERHPEPPAEDPAPDAPVRAIWQVSGDELGIRWPDGETDYYSATLLRNHCPCAACIDEWTGKKILDPKTLPDDLTFREIKSVGRYALCPVFSDGHGTGIYHFARLRGIADARKK